MNKENLIYYLLSISMYPILTSSKTLSPSEWMKVCSNSITDGQLEFCALSLDQAKENTKNGKMENSSDYDIIIKEEAVKNKTQEYLSPKKRHLARKVCAKNLDVGQDHGHCELWFGIFGSSSSQFRHY